MDVSLCDEWRIIQARPSVQRKQAAAAREIGRSREISGRPQPPLR